MGDTLNGLTDRNSLCSQPSTARVHRRAARGQTYNHPFIIAAGGECGASSRVVLWVFFLPDLLSNYLLPTLWAGTCTQPRGFLPPFQYQARSFPARVCPLSSELIATLLESPCSCVRILSGPQFLSSEALELL